MSSFYMTKSNFDLLIATLTDIEDSAYLSQFQSYFDPNPATYNGQSVYFFKSDSAKADYANWITGLTADLYVNETNPFLAWSAVITGTSNQNSGGI